MKIVDIISRLIICAFSFYGFFKAFNLLFPKLENWSKSKGYSDFLESSIAALALLIYILCVFLVIY